MNLFWSQSLGKPHSLDFPEAPTHEHRRTPHSACAELPKTGCGFLLEFEKNVAFFFFDSVQTLPAISRYSQKSDRRPSQKILSSATRGGARRDYTVGPDQQDQGSRKFKIVT